MSYNDDLQSKNAALASILETVRSLPEAGGGGGADIISQMENIEQFELVVSEQISTTQQLYDFITDGRSKTSDCYIAQIENDGEWYNMIKHAFYTNGSGANYRFRNGVYSYVQVATGWDADVRPGQIIRVIHAHGEA